MRRLGRYIVNGLTGLSLLLCLGTCALWVRSHWRMDMLSYAPSRGSPVFGVYTLPGEVRAWSNPSARVRSQPAGWDRRWYPITAKVTDVQPFH